MAHRRQIPDERFAIRSPSDDDAGCVGIRAGEVDERDRLNALTLGVAAERVDDLAFAKRNDTYAACSAADDCER